MLLLVSRHRAELSRYYRLLLPSEELIEILVDKARFAARAQQLGIPVPGTVTSWEAESADEVLARLSLPLILKPAVHVGWHQFQRERLPGRRPSKALLAETEADLRLFHQAIRTFTANFVVQEYIPGGSADHYSVHVWLDEQSRALGYFAGRKIRTYPKESGHSTCLELVDHQELVELGLDIVARLELRGPAKLDFKRDPRNGRFHLLEINPRYNLWHDLGARAGVNLPLLGYQYLSGVRPELRNQWNTRYKWIAFGDDLRAAVRYYLPDGDLSWKDLLGSYIGPRVYEVFSWRDPGPWAVQMLRSLRPGTMMHALRRYFRHPRQPGSSHSSP
jgi:predicted ATP-grasp superfamily ATP-dependent carboligase